jgi:hypothetical protein
MNSYVPFALKLVGKRLTKETKEYNIKSYKTSSMKLRTKEDC